ncbi:MAG: transcription-repair coupling factor [Alphaproteobacteria bacterium]|nr:transcription-repair coupling factor [Alphaproteobacteria bacterium]
MQYDINKLKSYTISSVAEGFDSFLLKDFSAQTKDILYIVSDGVELVNTASLLEYINPEVQVLRFPAWDTVPYDRVSPNSSIVAERIKTLSELALNPTPKRSRITIASMGAIIQKLPPKKIFVNAVRELVVGSELKFDDFLHYLVINGYTRVEQVFESGEYAVRGDIVDIYPVGTEHPLRIDLFDEEIERIRTFDVMTQRTIGELKSYVFRVMSEVILDNNTIKTFRGKYREAFGSVFKDDEIYEAVSNGKKYLGMENWLPFFYEDSLIGLFDYLPNAKLILGKNINEALQAKTESIADYYQARLEALQVKSATEIDNYRPIKPELLYYTSAEFKAISDKRCNVNFTPLSVPDTDEISNCDVIPVRNFSSAKNIAAGQVYTELKDYLNQNKSLKRIIACYTEGSRERIASLLNEYGVSAITLADTWAEALKKSVDKTVLTIMPLAHGFKSKDFLLISEQDILGERQNRHHSKKVTSKDFIADISSLSVGDLVVHIEHGIGRFMGLENVTAGGAPHDCLKIIYANDDKLFVPVENIDVLSRYGSDDENIQLDTLGGVAWQAKKAKVKQKIKDIAEKLIKIAAERQLKKADCFIPQQGIFDDFCSRFPYDETEDQLNAIHDVLADLNTTVPMDRLVCGDVGFGKTEVALRAAFAVASSGAQVALIVPTTLLARQHYLNFKQRMSGFPVRVKMLSRLVSAKESAETKKGLEEGSVEIVIGTHALLSKDIKFCNLGLLIIDEEQHFGVAHKEKIKQLKSDVHVLTLTATPIPRTLQLSLTGVKQLSIIATPPVDRLAARTFVMPFDKVMIKEAIYREKFRGGQIFFVCPRVSDIFGIEQELRTLVPDIKILVAHGQMSVRQLEEVMNDFSEGKADMLLSTTIIESGIDMPSVNTMIVYRSDMFGLAQLYQLKGRIGRGKKRGYAYFTIPPKRQLKGIAERRLNILQALDTLGAGFSLASHDMDIRGSGNVLGEEQSGHIKEVGISLYHHMLEEEILRLRSGAIAEGEQSKSQDWAPQITTGIPIMIPETYVRDLGVRLGLYKRIGEIDNINAIADMKEELIDRFGAIPPEVGNLLKTVEIKIMCRKAGIDKIDAGSKGILISLKGNTFSKPEKLMEYIFSSFGAIKVRPDQKIFIEKDLSEYAVRVETIKKYVSQLCNLLD